MTELDIDTECKVCYNGNIYMKHKDNKADEINLSLPEGKVIIDNRRAIFMAIGGLAINFVKDIASPVIKSIRGVLPEPFDVANHLSSITNTLIGGNLLTLLFTGLERYKIVDEETLTKRRLGRAAMVSALSLGTVFCAEGISLVSNIGTFDPIDAAYGLATSVLNVIGSQPRVVRNPNKISAKNKEKLLRQIERLEDEQQG